MRRASLGLVRAMTSQSKSYAKLNYSSRTLSTLPHGIRCVCVKSLLCSSVPTAARPFIFLYTNIYIKRIISKVWKLLLLRTTRDETAHRLAVGVIMGAADTTFIIEPCGFGLGGDWGCDIKVSVK